MIAVAFLEVSSNFGEDLKTSTTQKFAWYAKQGKKTISLCVHLNCFLNNKILFISLT